MFEREAIKWLREWRAKSDRKPLVLRGARQVGKTSLVKSFGKEFDVFIYLNLDQKEDLDLFREEVSVSSLYELLLAVKGKPKDPSHTLLFIDEIQNSALAIKMLRYFYEEIPELCVVAAGSLLETLVNVNLSFPVGRVEYMALRPCSFREFLNALGENALAEMVKNVSVPALLHEKVMSLFNKYVLVGGMPQAVAQYAAKRDIVSLRNVYQSLLTGYMDDVEKYESKTVMRQLLRLIITKGWAFADERIVFGNFAESNYKSRDVAEAMRMLEKALLVELVYPTTACHVPVVPDMKKRPRMMWLDTGLMNYAAGVQSELFGKSDITDSWRGKQAEHVVGQELIVHNPMFLNARSFWVREDRNSQAELDYLYNHPLYGLFPIEVKSGHNAHLKSLHLFMTESKLRKAFRFWNHPYSVDEVEVDNKYSKCNFVLYNMPYYYAGEVETIIEKVCKEGGM